MFSKRHYEAFAEVIQRLDDPAYRNAATSICVLVFSLKDNHFNAERFRHACLPGNNIRARTAHLNEKH